MVTGEKEKRILVLRYRFIGDTILTVPFLRNLRRAEPEAFIAWVVAPGSAEVIKGIPYVDELIYWDPPTIHADSRSTHRTWQQKLAFIRELRSRSFDTVYVLKRSLSSALMAWFTGAPKRVGFATEGRGLLLTTRVPYDHDRHEVLNFLEVLRADGVPVVDDHLECWTTPAEQAEAAALLAAAGVGEQPILALHPFGSIYEKTWPLECFADAARQLAATHGLVPVVLGAPGDREIYVSGRQLFPPGTGDLVGRCGIRTSVAVLQRAALFLGNDSGVMHLAAAAGVPLLALFGPTSPQRFGPWGARTRVIYHAYPCSPCRQKYFTECDPSPRGRPACIEAITLDEVLAAAREVLAA
jgi:heptosyltransferase-2